MVLGARSQFCVLKHSTWKDSQHTHLVYFDFFLGGGQCYNNSKYCYIKTIIVRLR